MAVKQSGRNHRTTPVVATAFIAAQDKTKPESECDVQRCGPNTMAAKDQLSGFVAVATSLVTDFDAADLESSDAPLVVT